MTRKIIDKVEYLKTQTALEKCLAATPQLELVPGIHNVNLIPEGLNMTGTGQFGPLEMGGMFTVFKVRKDQKPGDYKDPGPYKFPEGTVAYEWNGALPPTPRPAASSDTTPATAQAIKPTAKGMSH